MRDAFFLPLHSLTTCIKTLDLHVAFLEQLHKRGIDVFVDEAVRGEVIALSCPRLKALMGISIDLKESLVDDDSKPTYCFLVGPSLLWEVIHGLIDLIA